MKLFCWPYTGHPVVKDTTHLQFDISIPAPIISARVILIENLLHPLAAVLADRPDLSGREATQEPSAPCRALSCVQYCN